MPEGEPGGNAGGLEYDQKFMKEVEEE